MPKTIRIKLKSYDNKILDNSCKEIVDVAKRTGAEISGPIPLPTKRRVYTVLRSPHVDKKSREQFEIRVHKRLIDINADERSMVLIMKIIFPEAVLVEIELI